MAYVICLSNLEIDWIKQLVKESDYRAKMTDFNDLPCKCELGKIYGGRNCCDYRWRTSDV